MTLPSDARSQIIRALENLPPERLVIVAEFVEFLRAKFGVHASSGRVVKLGGLWKGYTFSEEEVRAPRREAWAGLGRDTDR